MAQDGEEEQPTFLMTARSVARLADIPSGVPLMPEQGRAVAIADVQRVIDGLGNVPGLEDEERVKAEAGLRALQGAIQSGDPDRIRTAAQSPQLAEMNRGLAEMAHSQMPQQAAGMGGPQGGPPPGVSPAQHAFLTAASAVAGLADIPPGAPPMPEQGRAVAIADVQQVIDGLGNLPGMSAEKRTQAETGLRALQGAIQSGDPDRIRTAAQAPLDGMHQAVGAMVQAMPQQAAGMGGPQGGPPPGMPPMGPGQQAAAGLDQFAQVLRAAPPNAPPMPAEMRAHALQDIQTVLATMPANMPEREARQQELTALQTALQNPAASLATIRDAASSAFPPHPGEQHGSQTMGGPPPGISNGSPMIGGANGPGGPSAAASQDPNIGAQLNTQAAASRPQQFAVQTGNITVAAQSSPGGGAAQQQGQSI